MAGRPDDQVREETAPTAPVRAVLAAVAVNLAGVLPLFLTGAMAVQIGRDLSFGPAGIGLLSGTYAAAAMMASAPLGRRVGALGVRRSMHAASMAAAAALSLAALSPSMIVLAVAMLLGGLANSIGQPAANAMVVGHLPAHRYGIGFAVKQSGIPLATLLAGLAVPTIALSVGWRWAYAAAALFALASLVVPPADVRSADGHIKEGPIPALERSTVWLLAGSLLLAVVAATSIGAFGASGGVAVGLSEADAGLLVAAGGLAGLVFRLSLGLIADRVGRGALAMVSWLIAIGSLGWALMATQDSRLYIVGLLVANAFGWGWPGLLHLSVARLFPAATAAASGVTQTGVSAGLLVGPLTLGLLITAAGWSAAWAAASLSAFAASLLVWLTRRRFLSQRGGPR